MGRNGIRTKTNNAFIGLLIIKMIVVKRKIQGTYNVIDYVYKDGVLIGSPQSNISGKNRFRAKNYKYNNTILKIDHWEHIKSEN